jgi:hypothetical protein
VGEAEAVGADDGAILQGDVVAEAATLADDGVGVGEEMAADLGVGIDDDMRQKRGVVADDDVVADDNVSADVGFWADLRGGSDDGSGMDSGGVGRGLVEEFEGAGEGQIGITDAQGRGGDGPKEGSTRTAVACVVRARGVYLGLATKVSWPGPATSRPAAEVTSASGSPCRVAPR